jgi:hypothetical protein
MVTPFLPDVVRTVVGKDYARKCDSVTGIGVSRSASGVLGRLGTENEVRHIEIFESSLDHGDWAFIGRCKRLESFRVVDSGLTDAACQMIGELNGVRNLSITREDKITSAGLSTVAGPDVQTLTIDDCPLVDSRAVEQVAMRQKLQSVSLSGRQFGDSVITQLSKCHRLSNVSLDNTDISDDGAKLLSEMPTLDTVVVGRCNRLSSAGMESLVESLASSRIRMILWYDVSMSDLELDTLKNKYPRLIWGGECARGRVRRP